MREYGTKYINHIKAFWDKRTMNQKATFIGIIVIVFFMLIGIVYMATKKDFVPLYHNLSLEEVGQIKNELETRGIPYELDHGGTTIKVPEQEVNTLLVDLAAQKIPSSGGIDYSFFSENASWGITDNEFNMMKLDAIQTELANLIKSIEGIQDANVMITMPRESVFVREDDEYASASIIIHTDYGYQFKENQIESLYHLVSKAVPNLPPENIVIRNQYLEYFEPRDDSGFDSQYTYQQTVKKDIERDLERRLQQMLGTMVGYENVIVSVTADIDFTQENRIEDLVEPVDIDNMEGVPISIETIHETYSGMPRDGGIPGAGTEEVPGYEGVIDGTEGEYELIKETINHEYNRIRKEIVESPYKVRDIGIQVAVNNAMPGDNEVQYLTNVEQNSVEESISEILHSIIATSVDKDFSEIERDANISIVFQEFSGIEAPSVTDTPGIPQWLYVVGGVLLAIIILLLVLLFNRRSGDDEIVSEEVTYEQAIDLPNIEEEPETEAMLRQKQLEKMAKEKPEDFAKLLRSWIAED